VYSNEALLEVWKLKYTQKVLIEQGMLNNQLDVMKFVDHHFAKIVMEIPKGCKQTQK